MGGSCLKHTLICQNIPSFVKMPKRPRRLNMALRRARTRRARFARRQTRRRTPIYRTVANRGFSARASRLQNIGGFPKRKTTVLRYVEDFNLNPGDGTTAVAVYRCNNLDDPTYASGGHQPMFFDNYKALYGKYKVNYATITFVCLSNHIVNTSTESLSSGTSSGTNQFFAANERAARMFILNDVSATDYPNDLDNLIEEGNKNMRWKYAPSTTSGAMHKLRFRCYPHKLQNLSFRDSTLSTLTSGPPANECYFIVGVDSMPGYNADQMKYQVIITYNVTFFDFIGNQAQN